MQIVEVNLIDGYPFYCPITGQQILTEDDFIPSPAMVYCYVQNESAFEYLSEEAMKLFEGSIHDDNCLDYEQYEKNIQSLMSYEKTKSWICFRLCSGGRGRHSFVVDHCIDMEYGS